MSDWYDFDVILPPPGAVINAIGKAGLVTKLKVDIMLMGVAFFKNSDYTSNDFDKWQYFNDDSRAK